MARLISLLQHGLKTLFSDAILAGTIVVTFSASVLVFMTLWPLSEHWATNLGIGLMCGAASTLTVASNHFLLATEPRDP
jgi:preprotein translocase subunit SecF